MATILVVDDETAILEIVQRYLEREGHSVLTAEDGQRALTLYLQKPVDLIITDIMMPQMDGYEFIERVTQENEQMPFIFISAKDQEQDKIFSLTLGAEDYITKPFSPRELTLRVKNILRRVAPKENLSPIIQTTCFYVDKDKFQASLYGVPLTLSIKEFEILGLFLQDLGKVFPKSELYQKVWQTEDFTDANTLNVHIHSLREKLAQAAGDKPYPHIQTVWGLGYKMEEE